MGATSDEYQSAVKPLSTFIERRYNPQFSSYVAAIRAGDERAMASEAARLEELADELESLWTVTLFSKFSEEGGVMVNEAAGAMAMLSDLWRELATAHRDHLGGRGA